MNIFDKIEQNAIKNNYINKTAITQIMPSNKIKIISYKELFELSTRISQLLLKLEIKDKDRIYISTNDSINFISSFLGAIKIGIVPIPGNPELSKEHTLHILNDSKPTIILSDNALKKNKLKFRYSIYKNNNWKKLLSKIHLKKIKTTNSKNNQVAFLIYSSGTTGLPKAIIHQHEIITNTYFLHKDILKLHPEDTIFTTSKLFFAYALGNNFFAPLLIGLNTIFNDNLLDNPNLTYIIKNFNPKVIFSVPTIYRRLLEDSGTNLKILSEVQYFISAGERIPNKLYKEWKSKVKSPLLNCYGTTETLAIVIATRPKNSKIGSTGEPIKNIKTKLLDNNDTLSRTNGVLHIKHSAFSKKYLNNKNKSEKTFHRGWIKTGDIWSIKNKHWYYQGREDDLIKVAGKWVNPKEIENIASNINNVLDAFCISFNTKQETLRLALFLYVNKIKNEDLIVKKFKTKISSLPNYKKPYMIKVIDKLPQTSTGKIKRNDLHKLIKEKFDEPSKNKTI
ncbi:MAG: AMP-binding protein [Alphaproteobacteria bacterium]